MNVLSYLRSWWQQQTGEDDHPFDTETPAWFVSLVFHAALLLVIAFMTAVRFDEPKVLTLELPVENEIEEELILPDVFHHAAIEVPEIGAVNLEETDIPKSEAPVVADDSQVPTPDVAAVDNAPIQVDLIAEIATAPNFSSNRPVAGSVGQATTGAGGAIDRITHEILLSLEERKTLVVWLFDRSPSLHVQRQEIADRLDRIYEELGVIEASGNKAFARHDDKPLLTAVVGYGERPDLYTPQPTDNVAEIKKAIAGMERDDSGKEMTFSSVYMAADKYKGYRTLDPATGKPKRNVMIVVFTDEVGDDQEGLDMTVQMCRRYQMPVYVVGVPAPFGRDVTLLKWVDPDPEYDQTPQFGQVKQGPESLMPELLKLAFSGSDMNEEPIDSGFGPFALTRLCYETGGIYFTVHPNRNMSRSVRANEVAAYSSHLTHFFDPQVMRRYRPDYVSVEEYGRRLGQNKSRAALVQAARQSWITPMESPRLRFVKRDEAALANALTEAQKGAAKLEPKADQIYQMLKLGEEERDKETTLRWQAGYDLAMGRAIAIKVRTESYNAMLAAAKRGLEFKDPKNNTWNLKPSDEISVGSQLQKLAERGRMYLQRVIDEHPDTPWALLAERELKEPMGWTWTESYTNLNPPRQNDNNAPPPPLTDENVRMLPPPKRDVPKNL